MSALPVETGPLAQDIQFTDINLIVSLVDGRKIIVPLASFPRLKAATEEQLEKFEILADGEGIHWPELDEDLGVTGLLRGTHEDA